MSFAAPALPYISVGLGIAQYKQQGAAGKFNQAIQNRNAQISEQESAQIQKQLEFDLARFDQQFGKIQGATTTSVLKSGAALEGSGLRLLRTNAIEAQLQKNIIEYNSKVGQAKKMEEANFYRIQGQIARQQARSAQLSTLFSTGTSLLTMGGSFGGAKKFDGANSFSQYASNPTGYSGSF
jgi:hypothetical protein